MRRSVSVVVVVALMGVLGSSLWVAWDARREAQELRAELSSVRAEIRRGDRAVNEGAAKVVGPMLTALSRLERRVKSLEDNSGDADLFMPREAIEDQRQADDLRSLRQEVFFFCLRVERELDRPLWCPS